MASSFTVTRVLTNQKCNSKNYTEYDAKVGSRENYNNKKCDIELKPVDYYDEALPKNDPKFLVPLRNWEKRAGFVTPIRWTNTVLISAFHILVITIPLYRHFMGHRPMWQSVLFGIFTGGVSGFGVTAGAHRYWTHRSYKAKRPLQILLMLAFSCSGQNTIYDWVRDHRVHHKMSETSADPHNAHRGFFFSHVGWLMMKKHPHVIREGNRIDMTDIINDPIIKFHQKYFIVLKMALCFIIPTLINLCWEDSWAMALTVTMTRYMLSLNFTWSVNSFAHIWGNKPYDINITPVENWKVSLFAMGEGWHNYHHTFPWDYKAAELAYFINISTLCIDLFARLGWAYDLKKASPLLIEAIIKKKGPTTALKTVEE